MNRLLILLATLFALALPDLAEAQSGDDRGYLQAFLEDNLSDAGRIVRITGFAGALSKRATIEELTIADDTGVWITLRKVVLDWDRSALLKGHLNITQLSAAEILLPRGPVAVDNDLPSPEASGFSLPELPVSITIGSVTAPRIVLGKVLIGEEAVIDLQASANLADGAGQTMLAVNRIDGSKGKLSFAASYSNATRYLDVSLAHSEARDGIAANLIGVPGRPSVELSVRGAGLLENFTADISLATDGKPRLAGMVSLSESPEATELADAEGLTFTADIGGDIAPVFVPKHRAFFGSDIRLKLAGARLGDGRFRVDTLALTTRALQLRGQLNLGADGWPSEASLAGKIADETGASVLLPLPGSETRIDGGRLTLDYDRQVGDTWRTEIAVTGFSRSELAIADMRLTGSGSLAQGDGSTIRQLQGNLTYGAQGIVPTDPALAQAIGSNLSGGLHFEWAEAMPLVLSSLTASSSDYGLAGNARLQGLSDGLNLSVDGTVSLTADDLSRFSGLAGRPLDGAAKLNVTGLAFPLAGLFDLQLQGTGDNLIVGQRQIDPLLQGKSRLDLIAKRDNTGTVIERFDIATDHLGARISGALVTGSSSLTVSAQINETARMDIGLGGPVTLAGDVQQTEADWAVDLQATGPGNSLVDAKGILTVDNADLARVDGRVRVSAPTLAPFQDMAGRPVTGAVDMEVTGWLDPRAGAFDAALTGSGQSVGVGVPMLDQLLRGTSAMKAKLHRGGGDVVIFDQFDLSTPQGKVVVAGTLSDDSTVLKFDANLRDLGLIAPGISGPAQAGGTASLIGQGWQIAAQGTGPGGAVARVSGQIAADASRATLALSGAAPLALANSFISPNVISGLAAYDLTLDGPIDLASLSGLVRTEAARLAVPEQQLSFAPIAATVRMSGGRAIVDASTPVSSGGRVTVSGPVSLTSPFDADLVLQLNSIGVSQEPLYDSSVDGRMTLRGPLTSGATIIADLTLGATEVRVAENGASSVPVLTGLRHIHEPADVRQTRAWAGLLQTDTSGGGGAVYPIDITLRAPSRIFVRGRGLDAELGGQLRLTGTTIDVITQGRFDLIRGRLDILGKRLTLSEGFARLQGGFDPYIFLVAQTRSNDTEIRIIAEGPASAPKVSFTSSPDLPEDEILARLLFGRDLTKISPLQAVQLAAAVQTLTGSGTGVVNKLRERFGLDDLDITTNEEGATGARVGKYVTENIYTDVTVGSDGSSEINLNLTLSPSLTARGSVTSKGENSLGLFFERDY